MTKIWKLADGVVAPNGCDPDGMPETAWTVVCHHVMAGMQIYGPFATADAAAAWKRDHVEEELYDITADASEWRVFVEAIAIPTHYTGAID